MEKQYGLIDPKANKTAAGKTNLTKHAAFNSSDSESEGKDAKKSVNLELGDAQKRQARAAQQKALAEDPTVYQYDELYDEMDSKRKEAKVDKSKEERKPKYIGKLLETAEKRKKEHERRIERQVQKERDAEGEKFQDKESFVTSAYRAKLEEMKKAEEEEKREEYLESIGDVTKQKDLGGFYRHIYSQKMGESAEKSCEGKVKEEKPDSKDESKKEQEKGDVEDDEEHARREALKSKAAPVAGSSKSRRYRKRHSDDDNEDEKNDSSKKIHLQSNLDADSDFSIDSKSDGSSSEDSDGSEGGKSKKKRVSSTEIAVSLKQDKTDEQSENNGIENGAKVKEEKKVEADSGEAVESERKENEKNEDKKKKEPKINIWKKRTIGEVFEAAQQRYYERKAARESG